MSKPTQEQIDAVFAELDIAFPLRNEITIAKALVEARVTLAAAAKRADAAEAERDALRKAVDAVRATRTERDALRTVDDAMVERAARATMNRVYKDNDLFADDEELLRIHREYARIAITAAMAVQPTTGEEA